MPYPSVKFQKKIRAQYPVPIA